MASRGSDPILEVSNATVTFEMDRGVSRVLDSLDVDIYREEILGIVGESGSGKSMFADSLLDAVVEPGQLTGDILYHPEPGRSVDVLGLSREELRRFRWEEISMVFQGAMSSFNPTISIRDHFLETLDSHDKDRETGIERTHQLLSDLYLDSERVLDSYPHELSGGMKQRALIALSLVLEPKVLVMDEPTAALDLLMQRSIIEMLTEIREKYEITIVFITHDLPLVADLADRIGVMYAFDIVEIGETHEILREPGHPYTRALLNATPSLNLELDEMRPIEGSSPDPIEMPDGCPYRPRCPIATTECGVKDPDYHDLSETHQAACYHWEEVATEMSKRPSESQEGDLR